MIHRAWSSTAKVIGTIGGMSRASTQTGDRVINTTIKQALGVFIQPTVFYAVRTFPRSKDASGGDWVQVDNLLPITA